MKTDLRIDIPKYILGHDIKFFVVMDVEDFLAGAIQQRCKIEVNYSVVPEPFGPAGALIITPKYVEVTLKGTEKFLVVMDDSDDTEMFLRRFLGVLRCSLDWYVVELDLPE
jgi:hypothetical protein